jgi:hypothetical protein
MKKFFLQHSKVIITTLVLVATLAVPLAMPMIARADLQSDINSNLANTGLGDELGGDNATLPETIGNIITVALGFLGVLFIVLILYAGFLWLIANGDDTKIKKAKGMMINSIIAVVIIFLAYAITNFVLVTVIGEGIINPSN